MSSTRDELARRLGVESLDLALLERALRHRSWCAEHPGESSNERLEFLGDAVLGLVVAHHLYERYPERPEGELAKIRAAVISEQTLAEAASGLEVGPALALGRGEEASGGREKPSLLADALEALIGATYLSGGLEAARSLVVRLLAGPLERAASVPGATDHKTRLQEEAARTGAPPPRYEVIGEGPDHEKVFRATVVVERGDGATVTARGEGRSKKQAEQAAAAGACEQLRSGRTEPSPGLARERGSDA